VEFGGDPVRDVTQFQEITPFSRLAILTLDAWEESGVDLEQEFRNVLSSLNLEQIEIVPVGVSLEAALSAIPSNAQAVYVTPLTRLSSVDLDRLIKALIERRLPTFSVGGGRGDVERGVLATLGPLDETLRRARRVAINIQNVLQGEPAAEIDVEYQLKERLTINMATARAIGISPPYTTLIEADLLNEEATQAARTLSLSGVVREASTVNLDLAVEDRTVAAGLDLVRETRSPLLPQVDLVGAATFINEDRAFLPISGKQQYLGSLRASQLIYSDRVWANYSIQQSFQELREEERAELRLDIILEAAESYLNVLRAKTIERVEKENLVLTRSNLQLARSRVEIGVAGREEEFRWESQIAINQKEVIDAESLRQQAVIAVNRVLDRPLQETFLTIEASLDDPELVSSFEEIGPYIESPGSFSVFSGFMVKETLAASPELRQLDAALRAQERELQASTRAFFLPDIELFGDLRAIENAGGETIPGLPDPGPWDWTVGLSATLPLFEGGGRSARRGRAQIELEEITTQRDATQQRIEQRIRSSLYQSNASFIGINLSRVAATAARRNLELVLEKYQEGVVDILVLLDAQNSALVADLLAANAIFDYLINLMGTQRAVGRFDYFRSAQDRQQFLDRLDAYFRSVGYEVRRR
jgi:outer membrane protein TolC